MSKAQIKDLGNWCRVSTSQVSLSKVSSFDGNPVGHSAEDSMFIGLFGGCLTKQIKVVSSCDNEVEEICWRI